jgi:uracil-DNA glycosylase
MLPEAWRGALDDAGASMLAALEERLAREARDAEIFPPLAARYRALELVAPSDVRVVILGQDPYHRPGQAMGLAFSVPRGVRVPPSLRNIHRELKDDLGIEPPGHGDLTGWATQGVLLLNTALSVRSGAPASHAGYGWHEVTAALLRFASRTASPSAFLLWGAHAQSRSTSIDASRHRVLAAGHPSFFSQHLFLGCRHFSQANAFLRANDRPPVSWLIEPRS